MKKRLLTIALAIVMLISILPTALADSGQQIVSGGADAATRLWQDTATGNELTSGTIGDGTAVVSTKKSVAAAENENEFTITLEVVTAETITETNIPGDALVVLVMDLSASMTAENNLTLNGVANQTRMQVALSAARSFIDSYADVGTYTNADVVRGLAIVGFATNVSPLYAWTNIADNGATAAKNSLNVIRPTNSTPWSTTGTGTNVAGGLRYANNLLGDIPASVTKGRTIDNVHVILLSDGGPTTAITSSNSSTNGYYRTTGTMNNTTSGNIPNSNLSGYGFPSVNLDNINSALSSSITWRGSDANNSRDTNDRYKACASSALYEATLLKGNTRTPTIHSIGFTTQNYTANQMGHWAYYLTTTGRNPVTDELSVNDFLRAVSTTGVVHDASDSITLDAAFRTIVGSIAADPWVVTDVMGSNIIFNGSTTATGVTFDNITNTLKWDLTSNALLTKTEDIGNNTTLYTYKYSYKITLDNMNGYVAGTDNDTNGSTSLTYVVKTNGVQGPQRTAQFTSPVIEGYAKGFAFEKVDEDGKALSGAKFGLWLSADNLTEGNAFMIAESDASGNVVFADLPSGHSYYLKELVAPEGFVLDETIHLITVSYGNISLKLYDGDSSNFWWFSLD